MRSPSAPRRTRRPRSLTLALLAVTSLTGVLLGGCADGEERRTVAMRSEQRAAADQSTPELPPSTPAPDSSSTTTTTAPGGSGEPDAEALCERIRGFSGEGATDDAEALLDELEAWREVAPDDLRDDVDALIGMVRTLESVDQNDPSSLAEVLETLTDPALQEAISGLGEFATNECRVDLDDNALGELPGLGG